MDFTVAAAVGRPLDPNSYKSMTIISQTNTSVLVSIVKDLKKRFLEGYGFPMSLQEILEELNLADISRSQREWLIKDALSNNVKIKVVEEKDEKDESKTITKYQYRPVLDLNLKDKNSLIRFIKEQYDTGKGPTLVDDILESLPRAQRRLDKLEEQKKIIVISKSTDKKKYIIYNDDKPEITIDDEIKKLWRSVSVEGVADEKIEEYLEKQGIQSIKGLTSRSVNPIQKRRKPARRLNKNFKAHNEHMKDILEEYPD